MAWDLYATFVAATVLLIVFPGPNVALIVASSLSQGRRGGLMTVAGVNLGLGVQLLLTVLGLSSLMLLLAEGLEWLRWAGAAYLVWLGIGEWRKAGRPPQPAGTAAPRGRAAFAKGLAVSLVNPKTLLFHMAFLPQFMDPAADPLVQLTILSLTFLTIAAVLDSGYALLAAHAAGAVRAPALARWAGRLTGSLLIGAGIGLAVARKS